MIKNQSGSIRRRCVLATCALTFFAMATTVAAQSASPGASAADKGGANANQPSNTMKGAPAASRGTQGMLGSQGMQGAQDKAASADMRGMMMKGMKEMDVMPMTGDTDRDFAAMMRIHHQGAVDMAQAELQHGKDATMRGMAKKIIDSQKKEIKEFDQWLAKRKH